MVLRQVKKNGKELTEELFNQKVDRYLKRLETNAKLKAQIPNDILKPTKVDLTYRIGQQKEFKCF